MERVFYNSILSLLKDTVSHTLLLLPKLQDIYPTLIKLIFEILDLSFGLIRFLIFRWDIIVKFLEEVILSPDALYQPYVKH